ncbi:hypothetical protein NliqN6_4937 [Naganishia liquefaciens]|uniref:ACB domain-containing protein n=1 Tax=Naganishia liquefaciens TaxID=104408 RepID=A0A8H3TWJ6_9TREE|nr:hypothetical protein NliqN6_4937 [Naganishia liquefaciens]
MTDHTLDPSLLDSHFHNAAAWLSSTPAAGNLATETKLEIYGLFKTATIGFQPNVPAPGFFSGPAAKAKHAAWKTQGEKYQRMAQDDSNETQDDAAFLATGQARAKSRYIEIAKEIGWSVPVEGEEENSKGSGMGMKVSTMRQEESPSGETDGVLPVHDAAAEGDLSALKRELARNPSSLNAQDSMGLTPLHLASDRGHVDAVRYLLESGADRMLKDSEDLLAYDMAKDLDRREIMRMLEEQ